MAQAAVTSEAASGPVLAAYEAKAQADGFERDGAQIALACAFDELREELIEAQDGGWRPFFRRRREKMRGVKGLYVYGEVGRGKTMLMDLFFEALPIEKKRRVHFNTFMSDVHRRVAFLRKQNVDAPVPKAAQKIADETEVLCFDEFAITDIADAMILARLFDRLFARGVTLVATSNVAPDDLYKDGLNRDLFLPFLRELRQNVEILRLDAQADFRLDRLEDRRVYFTGGDGGLNRLWRSLAAGREERSVAVKVASREIEAPRAIGGMARYTFAELCDAPRSAADFAAIGERFHTIFLENVPVMTPRNRETLRRFINLIDVLYDARVRLVVSAAAEPKALFDPRDGGADTEAFAFSRTQSRLYEMRSASYLNAVETTPLG